MTDTINPEPVLLWSKREDGAERVEVLPSMAEAQHRITADEDVCRALGMEPMRLMAWVARPLSEVRRFMLRAHDTEPGKETADA